MERNKKKERNPKKSKRSFPQRGCVYLVRFDPVQGSEIRKNRPAVVISNNQMNELARTVIVMPITTGQYDYFMRIPLFPPEGGLKHQSVIATEQVRAFDKQRLGKKLGQLRPKTISLIEQALRDNLGLPEGNILP